MTSRRRTLLLVVKKTSTRTRKNAAPQVAVSGTFTEVLLRRGVDRTVLRCREETRNAGGSSAASCSSSAAAATTRSLWASSVLLRRLPHHAQRKRHLHNSACSHGATSLSPVMATASGSDDCWGCYGVGCSSEISIQPLQARTGTFDRWSVDESPFSDVASRTVSVHLLLEERRHPVLLLLVTLNDMSGSAILVRLL